MFEGRKSSLGRRKIIILNKPWPIMYDTEEDGPREERRKFSTQNHSRLLSVCEDHECVCFLSGVDGQFLD